MTTGKTYNTSVGKMACKSYLVIKHLNTKWIPQEPKLLGKLLSIGKKEKGCIYHEGYKLHKCAEKGVDPFWGIRKMSKYWEYLWKIQDIFWEAPNHLFWICGDTAYTNLPGN